MYVAVWHMGCCPFYVVKKALSSYQYFEHKCHSVEENFILSQSNSHTVHFQFSANNPVIYLWNTRHWKWKRSQSTIQDHTNLSDSSHFL